VKHSSQLQRATRSFDENLRSSVLVAIGVHSAMAAFYYVVFNREFD
jgi:hypothetical protein